MKRVETIGILQPSYLPWLGYFEQLARADRFVFLDDVQYTRQDWRNRNRIKTASGPIWLTVPVKKHSLGAQIREIEVNYEHRWQRRHLLSIEQSYSKSRYFQPFFGELEQELSTRVSRLVDLDCRLIRLICRYLGIDTPTCRSSELPTNDGLRPVTGPGAVSDPNQRLIDICRYFGAARFYEGASGAAYIDVERFQRSGLEVVFQAYRHPSYPQAFGDFVSHLSAIDLIMNTGPDAPEILRSSPPPGGELAAEHAGRVRRQSR